MKLSGPIAPLSEVTYNFTQKVDYSASAYTVVGSVNFSDAVVSNNSLLEQLMN
jgi:hypothetical protein